MKFMWSRNRNKSSENVGEKDPQDSTSTVDCQDTSPPESPAVEEPRKRTSRNRGKKSSKDDMDASSVRSSSKRMDDSSKYRFGRSKTTTDCTKKHHNKQVNPFLLSEKEIKKQMQEMDPDQIMKVLQKFAEEDSKGFVGKECMKAVKKAEQIKSGQDSASTLQNSTSTMQNSASTMMTTKSPMVDRKARDLSKKSPALDKKTRKVEQPPSSKGFTISPMLSPLSGGNRTRKTKGEKPPTTPCGTGGKPPRKQKNDAALLMMTEEEIQQQMKNMDPDQIMKVLKKFADEDSSDFVGKECLKAMQRGKHVKGGPDSTMMSPMKSPSASRGRRTSTGDLPTTAVGAGASGFGRQTAGARAPQCVDA